MTLPRRVLVLVVISCLVLAAGDTLATQWALRRDLGVAAVDRRTGDVVWEAWEPSDVPSGPSAEVRRSALTLLTQREAYDTADLRFPLTLAPGQVVTSRYIDGTSNVELALGRAQFVFGNYSARYARSGDTLYVITDGRLHTLSPRGAHDDRWVPDWTFDLVTEPGDRERAARTPWILQVETDGVWVADDRRIRRLAPSGRVEFDHLIADGPTYGLKELPAALSVGELVYYRYGRGVIALDRRTARERWRVATHRHPYPSRVAETDDLVLVQVGSDCPRTILEALGQGIPALPMSGPGVRRRVAAAAALLRAYGDGYPRLALRRWNARLRVPIREVEAALHHWPARRDRQRLIDFTVESLLRARPARGSVERRLSWAVLQELIYAKTPDTSGWLRGNYAYDTRDEHPLPLPDDHRTALVAEARSVLASGPDSEKGFAASILVSAVGWSAVSDAEIARLFLSPHESVWRWAGLALVEHGRRDEVVTLAGRRPEGERLSVIYMLGQVQPKETSPAERHFWLECMRRTPAAVAYVLYLTRPDPAPLELRQPLREFLADALRRSRTSPPTPPDTSTQREYDLKAALRLLDRWHDPEDTPLIASYLTYPHPFVREHAKALFEARQSASPRPE